MNTLNQAATPLTVVAPNLRAPYRYLVVEGPIGVGKTTLAGLLAERWSMQTLFEQPATNSFLERFYRDSPRFALPTQLQFLLQRSTQVRELVQQGDSALVSDFMPQKDSLFAKLTLPEDEFELYRALAERVDLAAPTPDLVVYLQASPEVLFARIQKRAIPMELQISDAYLRALCDAYNEFFYHYNGAPLLTINTEHLDPVGVESDLTLLLERIESMRGRKEYFNKGGEL